MCRLHVKTASSPSPQILPYLDPTYIQSRRPLPRLNVLGKRHLRAAKKGGRAWRYNQVLPKSCERPVRISSKCTVYPMNTILIVLVFQPLLSLCVLEVVCWMYYLDDRSPFLYIAALASFFLLCSSSSTSFVTIKLQCFNYDYFTFVQWEM